MCLCILGFINTWYLYLCFLDTQGKPVRTKGLVLRGWDVRHKDERNKEKYFIIFDGSGSQIFLVLSFSISCIDNLHINLFTATMYVIYDYISALFLICSVCVYVYVGGLLKLKANTALIAQTWTEKIALVISGEEKRVRQHVSTGVYILPYTLTHHTLTHHTHIHTLTYHTHTHTHTHRLRSRWLLSENGARLFICEFCSSIIIIYLTAITRVCVCVCVFIQSCFTVSVYSLVHVCVSLCNNHLCTYLDNMYKQDTKTFSMKNFTMIWQKKKRNKKNFRLADQLHCKGWDQLLKESYTGQGTLWIHWCQPYIFLVSFLFGWIIVTFFIGNVFASCLDTFVFMFNT